MNTAEDINWDLYQQEGHTKHIFKQFYNIQENKKNNKIHCLKVALQCNKLSL